MTDKTDKKEEVITQTKLAFDFLQKLYLEITYLIKEIEGQLSQEDEGFVIGKPSGYGVTTRNSTGLEPHYVDYWLYKKFSVFFVPKEYTQERSGKSTTHLGEQMKILYFRFVLDDNKIQEPIINFGVLQDFKKKRKSGPDKIEQLMGPIEYNDTKVFRGGENIHFEDANVSFNGKLLAVNLFDIGSAKDISEKIISPALEIFRE
jgi:hypothetical protein